jgi:hypothetical protein
MAGTRGEAPTCDGTAKVDSGEAAAVVETHASTMGSEAERAEDHERHGALAASVRIRDQWPLPAHTPDRSVVSISPCPKEATR